MTPPLGFVVLSHANPEQLTRLISTLNRLYDSSPVAIHHDFSQSTLDLRQFASNVTFVQPSLKTSWAHISVVHAGLAALRRLYEGNSPDWFVLLSAADYPVMAAPAVIDELQASPFDLYLDYQLAERNPAQLHVTTPSRMGTETPRWRRMAYDRYVAKTISYPSLTKRLKPTRRQMIIRDKSVLRLLNRLPPNWQCYAGDHWFTGNRKVAEILMSASETYPGLFDHFSDRFCPEESIYHTILCNRSDLRICNDNKRYTDWAGQDAHPRFLTMADLDAIRSSGCHFARKFSATEPSDVLDVIDRML